MTNPTGLILFFVVWIFIGLIAGALASTITFRNRSLLGNVILGMISTALGALVMNFLNLQYGDMLLLVLFSTLSAILISLIVPIGVIRRSGRSTSREEVMYL